jgi:DNA-binding CsgD family transcriptional regulator
VRNAIVGRADELAALEDLLDATSAGPAALILEGEPGIGKTTLLDAGRERAAARGHRILVARPAPAEVRLAHAGLADLLRDQPLDGLPPAQRAALDAALLRGDARAPDRRAVAAALLTVVETLAAAAPVLIVIDDLQWLDASTTVALAFALRRVSGRAGLLGACHPQTAALPGVPRRPLGPLAAPDVARLVRPLPPALAQRVGDLSGGNPLFALEIARTVTREEPTPTLPDTLKGLVSERLEGLPADVRLSLAVAAALERPEVALIAAALPETDVVAALTEAEAADIITFERGAVVFAHPLLAAGVAEHVPPARHRAIHARLAELVPDPEQRARHLARAAVQPEAATIAALDDAARLAADRGAPAAAAELLELARGLGADAPERCARAAAHHFEAGDTDRARALLEGIVDDLSAPAAARSLLGTIRHRDGSYAEAAAILTQALQEAEPGSPLAVTTALELSFVRTNQGLVAAAEPLVEQAARDAAALGDDGLLAQALTVRITVATLLGQGLDEAGLRQALALENPDRRCFVFHRPSLLAALLYAYVGDADAAQSAVDTVRARCRERGEDAELIYTAIHAIALRLWRGDAEGARALADEADDQAEQLGTRTARAIAASTRAQVAAWTGEADTARAAAERALATFSEDGSVLGALMPLATLAQLDLALGDAESAAARVGALAAGIAATPHGEPAAVAFVADAAEGLIGAGRAAEAEPIVAWLQERGATLDRAWAQAVGARARALLHAAAGDLDAAEQACADALAHHERLPAMPLERARTLLVLGGLRRRRRQRRAAREALEPALAAFTDLHAPLWARQARDELERVRPRRTTPTGLTDAERRIAALTAEGHTNREVAAALFVSPRTVEATLARVYRKLEIGSRAELGRRMAEVDAGAVTPPADRPR